MKTFKSILISFFLLSFSFSNIYAYSGGNGTLGDPFQINNSYDWQQLMYSSYDWASYFILTGDVDLT
jgi:hypothetical protein